MRDHIGKRVGAKASENVVGIRELKTNAARILRHVREARALYIVTHRGRAVGLILPLEEPFDVTASADVDEPGAAWDAFMRAGRRLERRFRPGVSGVSLLSATRR